LATMAGALASRMLATAIVLGHLVQKGLYDLKIRGKEGCSCYDSLKIEMSR
jgi:hypothetical protein